MRTLRAWLRRGQDEQGFTLVELLMVMVIIGVLAGIGFAGMGMLQKRTLSAKADTYWRVLDSAVTMYAMSGGDMATAANHTNEIEDWLGDYIDSDEEPWGNATRVDFDASPGPNTPPAGCIAPTELSDDGTYYCIVRSTKQDERVYEHDTNGKDLAVLVWVVEGRHVGAASNNRVVEFPE